jgi:hypothetical protein
MRFLHAVVATLALSMTPAFAQKLAPGLWENTTTMRGQDAEAAAAGAKLREDIAKLPPMQRKMMEERMAKQSGGSSGMTLGSAMDMMNGKPTTMQVCITPEHAASDFTPPTESRCKIDSRDRSGNNLRMKMSCGGEAPIVSDIEMSFASDRAFSSKMVVNKTENGQPRRIDITQAGRWVAADCGSVKPKGAMPLVTPPPTSAPAAK